MAIGNVELMHKCFSNTGAWEQQELRLRKQLLLLKPAAQVQVGKTKFFVTTFPTPQAPTPKKTEKQTQGSNQRLTALLIPSKVSVSNTVYGRIFHT